MLKRLSKINLPWFFWGVVILLHLIFFFIQWNQQNYYLIDSFEYAHAAYNFLDYGVMYSGDLDEAIRYDFFTKRPPAYPLILSIFIWMFGSETLVVWFQFFLSIGNVYLMLSILDKFELKYRYELSLFFLLLYPAQFIYVQWVMTEIFFQSCLLLMVSSVIYWKESDNHSWLWVYLLALLLGIFTKPILYLFILPSALVLLILGWKNLRIPLISSVFIPFLFVGLYMSWNASRTGFFHFSSIQNLSLLQYSTFHTISASQGAQIAETTVSFIQQTAAQKKSYREEQTYIQGRAAEEIRKVPLTYAGLHIRGMFNFFLDPGRFDLYNFMGWESQEEGGWQATFSEEGYAGVWYRFKRLPLGRSLLLLAILFGNLLKIAGILLLVFLSPIQREYKWILLGMILYISGLTGISGASRFAVPVFPILLITAATGWDALIKKWKSKKLAD